MLFGRKEKKSNDNSIYLNANGTMNSMDFIENFNIKTDIGYLKKMPDFELDKLKMRFMVKKLSEKLPIDSFFNAYSPVNNEIARIMAERQKKRENGQGESWYNQKELDALRRLTDDELFQKDMSLVSKYGRNSDEYVYYYSQIYYINQERKKQRPDTGMFEISETKKHKATPTTLAEHKKTVAPPVQKTKTEIQNKTQTEKYDTEKSQKNQKNGGKAGEDKVDYALKWMDKKYRPIEKRCVNKHTGERCIYLKNKAFIDEKQEYDHILVSDKGIFVIETKNYKGTLEIQKNGNWKRIDEKGCESGIDSPVPQVSRHRKLLESILHGFIPDDRAIYDIICIAHTSALIKGEANCEIPVVKSDSLESFIQKKYNESPYRINTKKVIETIYKYMVND